MNKFLIFFAALLCAYQLSCAQTEKGNQALGFNLSLQYNQSSDNSFDNTNSAGNASNYKNTSFALGPLYSYFIADKLDLGGSFTLNKFTNNTTYPNVSGTNKSHNNSYDALIYLRKYFLYANKIGIRTGPEIGYIWANQNYDYSAQNGGVYSSSGHAYQVGARLEAVYYPSKHLGVSALIANLNFQHGNNKSVNATNVDKSTSNSVNFDFINNGLGISLFYVFGSK
jgi:hypothetical protein